MIHLLAVLSMSVSVQPASAADPVKESLRTHLRGSLSMNRVVSFDEPPLKDIGARCDLVRTLIEILEERKDSPEYLEESKSAISVLGQYWRRDPDGRVPASLQRYALDASRPAEVRQQAVQRRGLIPDAEAPSFYAEMLRGHPAMASPLVAWLKATPEGIPGWMPIQKLYTPEVREALKAYLEPIVRNPNLLPGDRKYYSALIEDLDRAVGQAPDQNPTPKPTDTPPQERKPREGGVADAQKAKDDAEVMSSSNRTVVLVSFLGLAGVATLLLVLRRRS